ncbi:MAG: DNA polymerase/3'-5' exonuclease PolX [bacterium]|nr:DNA polymerase/3'-5' exonuclease PolX [bacterium]MDZ4296405.1 DNA polymerase/3'-5' exonuclease PolX [Patescibacteria group bacterium]
MSNQVIAKLLRELAIYAEMADIPFKPRAYERAAGAIEGMGEDVRGVYERGGLAALEAIEGVGRGIGERIEEYLNTGTIKERDRFKRKIPVDVTGLSAVEGVGPKMIKMLWGRLGITTVGELERAARAGKIRTLPRFGEKSEAKILKGVEFLKAAGGRLTLGEAAPLARAIVERLEKLRGVSMVSAVGSLRRMHETIGDIDLLAVAEKPETVMEFFAAMPEVLHVYAKGATKTMVRLTSNIDADLRVVGKDAYGAALQYFTGDKQHNIEVRKIALSLGLKLNEYGLFRGARRLPAKTEQDLYRRLGLQWMPPELRTASGEIEAARESRIPELIGYGDLKGDLQVQTNWTDGVHSIEEMAHAAMARGLEYIAVTDHTKNLAMTGGADEEKLLRQMEEIDRINARLSARGKRFRILKGAEVNILKDGSLDIADAVLRKLDVVGAAVHSYFRLPRAEQTRRVIAAMESPHVDIIFHPTGRVIHRREPIELDIEAVIAAAKETATVLEVDASPDRLDLKDEYIRTALAAGVKLAIDSDAHATGHFQFLEYGIAQARRGWTTAADVINTRPVEVMLRLLKGGR